jgi:putative ABC transport system permease protein
METFLRDVRHALRMFRKSPTFTVTAVAALAFGIGANTAIFSVVNAVLLKPIPFPDADRLVFLMNTTPDGSGPWASPAKLAHWRGLGDAVQDVSAARSNVMNYAGDIPEQLRAEQVSADYFRLVRAPILRGRGFSREEDLPGAAKTVVISHGLWTRRFARDPEVLGKSLLLSGDPYVVIGVMGPSFDVAEFGPPPDVWVPFQLDPSSTDQGHYFFAFGRLAPGVTLAQARARVVASSEEYRRKYPNALPPGSGFSVERVQEVLVRDVRQILLVLLGAVVLVLLIACANVANLLLVRATGRRREIAIRSALGAGRGRLVRQLLTESILLSLIGGALGLLLGMVAIKALLAVNTAGLPRLGENGAVVDVDWRVAVFTVVVSVATGVVFGLFPALHGSRADLGANLKEGGLRTGSGLRQNKARALLVVTEVALALVLLVGAALLIRTSVALRAVDAGFDAEHVLTMRTSLSGERFLRAATVDRLIHDGVERLRALPGVENASATCCIPLEGGYGLPFRVVGRPLTEQGPYHGNGGWLTVSPGYFEVFKIAVKRGRTFTDNDTSSSPPVAIINEAMAKAFWKDGDPLADRLVIGKGVMREFESEPERQIIGVVSDVRDGGLNRDPRPTMYIPQAQVPDAANALNVRLSPMAWVVRTRADPRALGGAVQEQLRQVTGLAASEVRPMDEIVSRSTSRQRFNMLVMTIFGAAALLLAAIGIYGLMSYSVEQRTQEIGIRLALGAESGQVRRMIVLQGMRLALLGVAVGIAAAFGLARLISSVLFGVKAWDPLVFISVPVVLAAVALVSVWWPAARASRVDPMSALRYE